MANKIDHRDLSKTLSAAKHWINICLVEDYSVLSDEMLWRPILVEETRKAFVEHLDEGKNDFITKRVMHVLI